MCTVCFVVLCWFVCFFLVHEVDLLVFLFSVATEEQGKDAAEKGGTSALCRAAKNDHEKVVRLL